MARTRRHVVGDARSKEVQVLLRQRDFNYFAAIAAEHDLRIGTVLGSILEMIVADDLYVALDLNFKDIFAGEKHGHH